MNTIGGSRNDGSSTQKPEADIYAGKYINISFKPDPEYNVIDVDMFGDINQEMAFRFDLMMDNTIQHFPSIKHIAITVCGHGHVADFVLAINNKLDALKSSGYTISTILTGQADTITAAICTGGTPGHRYIAPNTIVIITQLTSGVEGTMRSIKDTQTMLEIQQKIINKLFKTAGIEGSIVDELLDGNTYPLTPQQAVTKGFADKVSIRIPRIKAKK